MFKICAIVSSYYPNLVVLEKNILSYLPWVDHLIIWENTPQKDSIIYELIEKLNQEHLEVRTTGENEYLAKPFNECFDWAKENGFTHMLTMDQDSRFNENCFPQFINYIRNSENHSVAVFCSNYDNLDQTKESIELWAAITSGSIYPLAMFSNELRFREDFLIDVIDVEYCLHAREKGYKTLCFTGVRLVHELGYAKKTKFKFELNNYSAQRTYYIIRNIRLNWHLHPGEIPPKAKYNFYKYKVIYRIAKIMFEDHSLLKCKAIFLGLLHGKLLKGGKYDIV